MTALSFLNGRVTLHEGDCLAVLPTLPENSVDSVCVDPPYHLASIVKRWSGAGPPPVEGVFRRGTAGFMGKQWDGGDIAFRSNTWAAVLRVLKPGGHLLAFGGTRTYHLLAYAIEAAGFDVRDAILWHYGSGFPKSLSISKAIDKAAGAERKLTRPGTVERNGYGDDWDTGSSQNRPRYDVSATDAARQWEGWGTALKPATEIICLARKPLSEPTIAANVLRWGTGALNIGATRIGTTRDVQASLSKCKTPNGVYGDYGGGDARELDPNVGRWPANILLDGSEEVVAAFPETSASPSVGSTCGSFKGDSQFRTGAGGGFRDIERPNGFGDSGSAARFFYTAKADSDDRLGSKHPTVKPLDLMQYLVRLVTPPRGVVLDMFAGTGTTAEAAWREGFSAILIEREPEYVADIERRMKLCLAGQDERARESIKQKLKGKPVDAGPLFEGIA